MEHACRENVSAAIQRVTLNVAWESAPAGFESFFVDMLERPMRAHLAVITEVERGAL